MASSRNRPFKNILFAVVAVLGFFLILEAGIGLFEPRWRLVERVGREGDAEVFKTPDKERVLVPKPADVFRMIVLGCSAAHGTPFTGAGFPEQMQAIFELSYPERKFEVLNFAQEGASSMLGEPMLEQALRLKPDLVLVYLGNNEQLTYSRVNSVDHPLIFRAGRSLVLNSRVVGAVLLLEREILEAGAVHIMIGKYFLAEGKGPRFWPLSRKVKAREVWMRNLELMSKMAANAGTVLVISTMSANRSEWPPIRSVHRKGFVPSALSADPWALIRKNELEAAGAIIERSIAEDPEFALWWFYLGMVQQKSGQISEARASFEKAVALSDFQQETTWADNQALLQYCREKNLACMDLDSHFDGISPSGLAGFNLFMDHCHFNLQGSYQAALYFYRTLSQMGYLPVKAAETIPSFDQVIARLKLSPSWMGLTYFNYGLLLGHLFSRSELSAQAISLLAHAAELGFSPALSREHEALVWLKQDRLEDAAKALTLARKSNPADRAGKYKAQISGLVLSEEQFVAIKTSGVDWSKLYFSPTAYPRGKKPLKFSNADYYFQWDWTMQAYLDQTARTKGLLARVTTAPTTAYVVWAGPQSRELDHLADLRPSPKFNWFQVSGADPYLVFNTPGLENDQATGLMIWYDARGWKALRLELYWRPRAEPFREDRKIEFACSQGRCELDCIDYPAWLFSGPIAQVRIDFPAELKEFRLDRVQFNKIPGSSPN